MIPTDIIRDRIFDLKKKGMTLDQVQAAKPTRDYDPRWGCHHRPLDHRHVRRGRLQKSRREGNALNL